MLNIRSLDAGYGKLQVLKKVSLHVNEGEIVSIIGANGAGKTTLLHCLAGVVRPSGGHVTFKQANLRQVSPHAIIGHGLALVPEGRQVFAPMTVEENLFLGATCRKLSHDKVKEECEAVYTLFPRLKERFRQFAGTLSGGEQQMLAIGRGLMASPKLLMLDEPSMGLAPLIVKAIFEAIVALRKRGVTILLVEQNSRAALGIADRGYVMETGSIVLEGSAQDLLANNDVKRAYLGKDYRSIGDE